jgi:hypothetical protein
MSKAANDNGKASPTYEDAVECWLLRWQGWYQHRIAAHFGVNQGRISEVLTGKTHEGSRTAAEKIWKKLA